MKDNNRNTNHTNVILNSTSRGCKAEPYPFSASAEFQDLNKVIRKKGQGNKFVKEGTKALGHSGTKDLNSSLAPCGRGVGRGGNPLQKDAIICAPLEGEPKSLISKGGKNVLNCFITYNDKKGRHPEGTRAEDVRREPYPFNASVKNPKDLSTNVNLKPSPEFVSSPQLTNKFYPLTKREGKKNRNELINLSTYSLIDFKEILRLKPQDGINNVKTLVPQCPSALMPLKKKAAFTLAEVLITLGIIGIVAAMTIPNLITTHQQKVTSAKLRKAVSTLNQAIKMSESENGEMETWDKSLSYEDFINKYFRPYIKISMTCYPMTKCGYPKGSSQFKALNGLSWGYANANYGGRTPFIDMDGILYAFSFFLKGSEYQGGDNDKIIMIDVNASQPPNTYGKDVFFLYRIEEADSIVPYGADLPQETIMQNCSKTGPGVYCAALIKQNGWEFPKGYPWK